MALLALRPELALMNIIRNVTAAAARRHVGRTRGRIAVAVDTGKALMAAIECETRVTVVIECRRPPIVAVVAGSAFVAERSFVHVAIPMALRTGVFRIVESIARVAGATSNRRVQARQREGRQIMVEPDGLPPGLLRMALQTIFAELACVRIVHGMACATAVRH